MHGRLSQPTRLTISFTLWMSSLPPNRPCGQIHMRRHTHIRYPFFIGSHSLCDWEYLTFRPRYVLHSTDAHNTFWDRFHTRTQGTSRYVYIDQRPLLIRAVSDTNAETKDVRLFVFVWVICSASVAMANAYIKYVYLHQPYHSYSYIHWNVCSLNISIHCAQDIFASCDAWTLRTSCGDGKWFRSQGMFCIHCFIFRMSSVAILIFQVRIKYRRISLPESDRRNWGNSIQSTANFRWYKLDNINCIK